jgi:hypothetical protein
MSFYLMMSWLCSRQSSLAIVAYGSPIANNEIVEDMLQIALLVAHDLLNTGTCRWCLEVLTRRCSWLPAKL